MSDKDRIAQLERKLAEARRAAAAYDRLVDALDRWQRVDGKHTSVELTEIRTILEGARCLE